MTSTPPISTTASFVVLDADLPNHRLLGQADDYDAALHVLAAVKEEIVDQLDANGEGGPTAELALSLAAIDVTGTVGPPCYWVTINGIRLLDLRGGRAAALRRASTPPLRPGAKPSRR